MRPAWRLGGRRGLAEGLAGATLALVLGLSPTVALAHPLVDQAEARFEEADFEGALEAFAQAEQATDLGRNDLLLVYLRRALVHHAMGQTDAIDMDLFRLATLEPRYRLGREVPPQVRDRFATQARRVEERLRVKVDATEARGGVRIRAQVTDDLAALVTAVRFGVRTAGGVWQRSDGAALEVMGDPDSEVEFYAEAVGPGGAVLASEGTSGAPRRSTIAGLLAPAETGPGPIVGGGGGGIPAWPFLVGGAVLVAVAVTLVVIFATGGNDGTQLSFPMPTL